MLLKWSFNLGTQINLNIPRGISHHLWGNNNRTPWVIKKYNGVFTKLLPDCNFNQEVCWLIPLPTSTWPTQRISIPVLYGGLLCDRISCMWWWDWTTEHFCRSGPLILSWFLSLTLLPRHDVYCACLNILVSIPAAAMMLVIHRARDYADTDSDGFLSWMNILMASVWHNGAVLTK